MANWLHVCKVWDIQDQNCLVTLRPKSHRITGDIQTCHYSSLSKTLVVATEQMNALSLSRRYYAFCLLSHNCKFTDRFSDPPRAVCSICVSVCLWTITFELNDCLQKYLAFCLLVLLDITFCRSHLKAKVVGLGRSCSSWSVVVEE